MTTTPCPQCGALLPPQARFCRRCGQPVAASHVVLPPESARAQQAELASGDTSVVRRLSSSLATFLPTNTTRKPSGFQGHLAPESPDVFISYSRKDKPFVQKLAAALAAAKRQAWVDWQDIPPTAKWLEEIFAGIEAATTFVFVLSPDSLTSEACMQEVAHALENKKRIIPLVCRPVHPQEVIAPLRELNWIGFTPLERFEQAVQEVLFALDTDLEYWHQAARWLTRAKEWESKGRTASGVLRGQELSEAERWLAEGATKQPSPTKLQTEWITASRRTATTRQRRTISGLSVASVVLSALTILSFVLYQISQTQQAQIQRQNTKIGQELGDALARGANLSLLRMDPASALLQAAQGWHFGNDLTTRDALLASLSSYQHLATILTVPSLPTAAGQVQDNRVLAGAFNPVDGSLLVFTQDGHVVRWDRKTHHPQPLFEVSYHFCYCPGSQSQVQMAVSPNGNQLAILTEGADGIKFAVWSLRTTTRLWQTSWPGFGDFHFTPDGNAVDLVTPTQSGTQLEALNSATGQIIGAPVLFPVANGFALSQDESRLVLITCTTESCDARWSLTLWDVAKQQILWQQSCDDVSTLDAVGPLLTFSPDGKHLLTPVCTSTTGSNSLQLWDVAAGSYPGSGGPPNNLSKSFQLWDVAAGIPLNPFNVGLDGIFSIALSPDGTQAVFGGCADAQCQKGQVLLQPLDPLEDGSLPEGEDLAGPIPYVNFVSFSPDGSQVLSLNDSDHLFLWNTDDSGVMKRFPVPVTNLVSFSFSPDWKYLASSTGEGGDTTLWNVADGKVMAIIPKAWDPFFSPDGKYLVAYTPPASTSWRSDPFGAFSLFDVATHTLIHSFNNDVCDSVFISLHLSFSSDSQKLLLPCLQIGTSEVTPTGAQINVWAISTGKLVAHQDLPGFEQLSLIEGQNCCANVVRASPDGKLVAMSSGDNSLFLWDLASGQLRKLSPPSDGGMISDFAFSPNSKEVAILDVNATAGQSTTTLWDLGTHTPSGPSFSAETGAPSAEDISTFFSQDGTSLASVGYFGDSSGTLIDLRPSQPQVFVHLVNLNPDPIAAYPNDYNIQNAALNPNGSLLAWAATGVEVLDLTPSDWEQQACQILTFSLQECATAPIPAD